MGKGGSGKKAEEKDDQPSDEEDDEDDLMTKRNAYVKKCIRETHPRGKPTGLMAGAKNPVVAELRRELIREFFKEAVAAKKCTSCSG